MIIPPFSITGIQHKHFRDGVDIDVTYTRNVTHITHINTVQFTYNSSTLELNYNCAYVTLLNNEGSVEVGGKIIKVVPRVGQIITELENTLIDDKINERILAGELPSLTDIESSIDIGTAESIDIGTADGGHRTITQADFSTRAVTTFHVEQSATKEPAPKRQRTRWELLELD